jgi:hypothetical protein
MKSDFSAQARLATPEAATGAGRLPKRVWVTPNISKLDSDETESGAAGTVENNGVGGCKASKTAAAVSTCPS